MDSNVIIHTADDAWQLLGDASFHSEWNELQAKTSWATSFQSAGFVTSWFDCYRMAYIPIIIARRNRKGVLTGLLIMGKGTGDGLLCVAGGHQAEYQSWLEVGGNKGGFLFQALEALESIHPKVEFRIKYFPKETVYSSQLIDDKWRRRMEIKNHARPIWIVRKEGVSESLRKKSNKSRLNRLKRLGNFEFEKIEDATRFSAVLDEVIPFYDIRQGAMNDSYPFLEDAAKKRFHLQLLRDFPNILHVTAMTIDGRAVSIHIGILGENQMHLAIVAHSPALAKYSPGKLHLLLLASEMSQTEATMFDLTPGGDPWKERFASDHDKVSEIVVYKNSGAKHQQRVRQLFKDIAKSILARVGFSHVSAKLFVEKLKNVQLQSVARRLGRFAWEQIEYRIYVYRRLDPSALTPASVAIRRDCLQDLLLFEPTEKWQAKQQFLRTALDRLERGEHVYTIVVDGRLLHFGWLIDAQKESYFTEVGQKFRYPQDGAVLYDFYSHPQARGRGLYQQGVSQMLRDLTVDDANRCIYISCLADNRPSRHVIEKLGFSHLSSLHRRRLVGKTASWRSDKMET